MEIIDTIKCASVSSIAIVGNVGLREEVGSVGARIDDWSADDANCAWNIGASDVGLQERWVDLSRVDESTSLCVECADPVLR